MQDSARMPLINTIKRDKIMKKILLTLVMSLSVSSAIADTPQLVSTLQKAPANSGVHQELNREFGGGFDQCSANCFADFYACLNAGIQSLRQCRLAVGACERRCLINNN